MIIRCYYNKLGGHVHCRVFSGPKAGALGKCGDLVFRLEEFAEFMMMCSSIQFLEVVAELNNGDKAAARV